MSDLSVAMQHYLETIFALSKKTEGVRVSDIAALLDVSKASVNNAMNVLAKLGYVSNEKYQEIFLTPLGKETAALLESKHTVLKTLFMQVLGMPEKLADDDACAIEHIISQEAVQHIRTYLREKGVHMEMANHSP